MADVMMHQQALISVCRGTSQPSQWADSSILPHQPYPSAGQSSPFSNGDLWPRGPFSYDQAALETFDLSTPGPFDNVLLHDYAEPSQTEKEFRDPALAVRLQLDQGEQYIIERYLRGETWHTIKEGFEARFGASRSSKKSALTMRFARLKQKHSEIRSLAEEAFPDRHLRRRKGRRDRWETEVQDESTQADQPPGVGQGGCSEQRQRERQGQPRNVSQKTFGKLKRRRITQREAALAADRLLVFLGLPKVQGLVAQSDCLSVVRVRSRLRE